jgi:acyl-CoA dehydrogenase
MKMDGIDQPCAATQLLLERLRSQRLLCPIIQLRENGTLADISSYARAVFEVARKDGSAGLMYAMHLSQYLSLCCHRRSNPLLEHIFEKAVSEQQLFASATSEIGTGGNVHLSLCKIEEDGGTMSVVKDCANISYLESADIILVTASRSWNAASRQVLIACARHQLTSDLVSTNRFMGMRGISHGRYTIKASFDETAIFEEEFREILSGTMTPLCMIFWASAWSGIASDAISKCKLFIKTRLDNAAANNAYERLYDLSTKHLALNSLIRSCCAAFEARDEPSLIPNSSYSRLKTFGSEISIQICVEALNLIGMAGYQESGEYSLSSNIVDILSSCVMIPNQLLRRQTAPFEAIEQQSI